MGDLFTELMRRLFSLLDGIVAWLIELLYVLLIKIADTNVFGELIYQYLGRIYTFLGIFMVFKLSFAMINYIANPDALTDKGKGFGKIITNTVISLILLAVTPNLFDIAFDIQSDLLSSNAIYQIVTGKQLPESNDTNSNKSLQENAKVQGKEMSYAVYSSFIYKSNDDNDYDLEDQKICEISKGAMCLMDEDVILTKNGKKFEYEYKYLVSTVCGCAVVYMLFMFCFDAAVRTIKLGFLQIIAPIPILSMIDPGKDSDKVKKWAKECGKTFIDLFVRLAGIFFALDVIHSILASDDTMKYYSSGASVNNIFVRLFIIIGCLMFAKQLPSLIESILGIKLGGDGFSLKKKLGGIPGLGAAKMVGAGALGFAGGMAANTWALGKNIKDRGLRYAFTGHEKGEKFHWNDISRSIGKFSTGIGGGISGAYKSATSKEKNMFKAAGAGISGAAAARNLRVERRDIDADGMAGAASRFGAKVSNLAGIESGATRFDKMSAALGNISSAKSELDKYLEATDTGVKIAKAEYDAAVQKGDTSNLTNLKKALDTAKDQAILSAGKGSTEAVLMKKYNETIKEANTIFNGAKYADGTAVEFSEASGYLDVKDSEGKAKGANTQLKNDGVTVGKRTWSSEHSGVKEKN